MSMDIANFKEYVKTRKALNTEEIHRFMGSPHHFPSEYRLSYTGRSA